MTATVEVGRRAPPASLASIVLLSVDDDISISVVEASSGGGDTVEGVDDGGGVNVFEDAGVAVAVDVETVGEALGVLVALVGLAFDVVVVVAAGDDTLSAGVLTAEPPPLLSVVSLPSSCAKA
jgi:hypothetical protein